MTLTDFDRLQIQQENPRAIRMWKAIQPLRSCVSFMNTGAHPDDETTTMLAALGMRDGVKLSQACANRGEGGQNAIGAELSKDLGVVRTREMERAAGVINMTHYWLSESPEDTIFDFGFSKSGDETLDKWGEQRVLDRFVRILRRERPDIVCTTFLDIPGQHGHHQAMTRSAFKAVELAADPMAFPEHDLNVWQVKKLYLPAWSGAGDAYDDDVPPPAETTRVDATGSDHVLGADYAQIAQASRRFHRTQGMGNWVEPGKASFWPLHLAWVSEGSAHSEPSIFTGLPKDLGELAEYVNAQIIEKHLSNAQLSIESAIAAWPDYGSIREHARKALNAIVSAKENCPKEAQDETLHRLSDKQRQLSHVLALSHDFRYRVSISANEIGGGENMSIQANIYAPDLEITPEVKAPVGWKISPWIKDVSNVSTPENTQPSNPYPDTWYPDRANDPLHVELTWWEKGQKVSISVDPEERLQVLPTPSAALSQTSAILNLSNTADIGITISQIRPAGADARLHAGDDWKIVHAAGLISVQPKKDLIEGLYDLPLLLDNKPAFNIRRMAYSHTGAINRCEPLSLKIRVMNIALPKGRIAYIGGGSDRVDYWLQMLGVDVDCLSNSAIKDLDFSRYDSVLIGIFAFQTCTNLQDRLSDLHNWVADGGNLVTLYHRPWDNWDPEITPPAYLQIGKPSLRWRVTDENAEVKHLTLDHPLLNVPNKITPDDWQGWDKERGLYFAAKWDKAYVPLIEMADPNEAPLKGALLSAVIGKGRHTHTSLILHHQLEKLVPGAYRLLANLLHSG